MSDPNTIQLKVLIPLLSVEAADRILQFIIDELKIYDVSIVDLYKDLNKIMIVFTIKDVNNANSVQKIMDAYVNEHTRIRYIMLIYWSQPNRIYPSSIHINKKGKKIIKYEQKKILVL